ncbi:MAG: UDP-N-acetylmuramoyl-tripeptide--D-alanyl-D-alanine ligase [Lentisphaerales bacterium]|jgi:UDP-N-acetylmuramoyl-tripeptide--D-alanyl-D-alanine ligase|nr:MAG: UDP-N-acetylmuramoyl-tripeptide--D-alanyl-D-alanine ligase [Lentisphaerales bacterium]
MPEFQATDLAEWAHGKWSPTAPRRVAGVSSDTRTLEPENVFVALRGPNHDGHSFVDEALKCGAAAAIVEAESGYTAARAGGCLLLVDDTLIALQRMAGCYRAGLSVETVAVSGSAGKTTVKEMTAAMLKYGGPVARSKGNLNNHVGVPLSLLAVEPGDWGGVFEVGMNHPGELRPLCEMIRPRWGIITNVGPAHVECFESISAIAEEKSEVLRALPADGTAVLDADGDYFDVLCRAVSCRLITVAIGKDADYVAVPDGTREGQIAITERSSGERVAVKMSIPGEHNIRNALLSTAVARGWGIGWKDIGAALESYRSLPNRWIVENVRGVTIINDAYNANPLSMRAAIDSFGEMKTGGRKWLVFAGMLELGSSEEREHIEIGRYAGSGPWAGVITVGELGKLIADGMVEAGFNPGQVIRCADNEATVETLAGLLEAGDAALLKGSRAMRLEEVRDRYVLLSV